MIHHRSPSPYLSPKGRGGVVGGAVSWYLFSGTNNLSTAGAPSPPKARRLAADGWGEGAPKSPSSPIPCNIQRVQNRRQHAVDISGHLPVGEAQDMISISLDYFGTCRIARQPLSRAMFIAIDLDDHSRAATGEVSDIISNNFLADKLLAAELPIPQAGPERALNHAAAAAQFLRDGGEFSRCHVSYPLILTFSLKGRRGFLCSTVSCKIISSTNKFSAAGAPSPCRGEGWGEGDRCSVPSNQTKSYPISKDCKNHAQTHRH
jgi:hypothetical protein